MRPAPAPELLSYVIRKPSFASYLALAIFVADFGMTCVPGPGLNMEPLGCRTLSVTVVGFAWHAFKLTFPNAVSKIGLT
jgi:hypothetical protein